MIKTKIQINWNNLQNEFDACRSMYDAGKDEKSIEMLEECANNIIQQIQNIDSRSSTG